MNNSSSTTPPQDTSSAATSRPAHAVDRMVVSCLNVLVIILGLFLAVSMALGIAFRVLFDAPLFGLEELVLMAAMWFYMLGAVLASHERSHLSADFVKAFAKNRRFRRGVKILSTAISLGICACFFTWSMSLVLWAIERGQITPVFGIPLYVSQASFVVASLLMLVYLVRDLVLDIDAFRQPVSPRPEQPSHNNP